jgi:hypothetical protein
MRHVAMSPIFLCLGGRMRGPADTPIGAIRRVSINNLVAYDADGNFGCVISGLPEHPIEDLRLSNITLVQQGGGTKETGDRVPPEEAKAYPEPSMFGTMPSYGFFFRHVRGLEMDHVKLDFMTPEARPAVTLSDVVDAYFDHLNFKRGTDNSPLFDLRDTGDFSVTDSRNISDTQRREKVGREKF